jgi:hypothetical protein
MRVTSSSSFLSVVNALISRPFSFYNLNETLQFYSSIIIIIIIYIDYDDLGEISIQYGKVLDVLSTLSYAVFPIVPLWYDILIVLQVVN